MKRTTTAKDSRRPVCATVALGLTLIAANLMAAQLTEYPFEAYDSLFETRTTTGGSDPVVTVPTNPDSDYTGTFYVTGANAGDEYDLDKPIVGDANLCWAYSFSCMVAWYQDMYASIGTTFIDKEPRTMSGILEALKNLSGNVSGSFSKAIDLYIQTGEYMLSYIDLNAWRPPSLTAYAYYYYSSYPTELGTLEGFSQLLLENLYRAPAFVDLLEENSSSSGHAVVIWGAEFENGIVKSVYISDSDDGMYQYTKYAVVCKNGRLFLDDHWAPRVNAVTFLYAPPGVPYTVPVNERPESFPELGANATASDVANALNGAHARIAKHVTDAAAYADFRTWANNVKDANGVAVDAAAVKASDRAWFSYALRSGTLITQDLTRDDVSIDKLQPKGNGCELTVALKGISVGPTADAARLATVIGIEGATSLDGTFSPDNVVIEAITTTDGKMKFTARPKVSSSSFFMRALVTP